LVFVFAFPLVNNLPYFFKIDTDIPHAPAALVLFLVFFLGWLIHNSFYFSRLSFDQEVFRPITLFSLIVILSGIITFFRYANFFPILSDSVHELIVNVNDVRAGGAIMSVVFGSLNYLTGVAFFIVLYNSIKSKELLKKLLCAFSISILVSLVFSLVQIYYSISIGNTSFFTILDRINSTFKDPNSFGVVLASSIPLFLGMFLSFHKCHRFFYLFLAIFGLLIFPSIGSRSGLLGLVVSLFLFILLFLLARNKGHKRKIVIVASSIMIIVLLVLSFYFLSTQTSLSKRLFWSLEAVAGEQVANTLLTRKPDFWTAAVHMTFDYPLTGIGVGAFIIELPNYLKLLDLPYTYTDSAENYFLQVSSELGLIGLIFVLWVFFEILRLMRKSWKRSSENSGARYVLIGAISGIVAVFVNLFFHSYIGSFEVKYFFWLLVAVVLVLTKEQYSRENDETFQ